MAMFSSNASILTLIIITIALLVVTSWIYIHGSDHDRLYGEQYSHKTASLSTGNGGKGLATTNEVTKRGLSGDLIVSSGRFVDSKNPLSVKQSSSTVAVEGSSVVPGAGATTIANIAASNSIANLHTESKRLAVGDAISTSSVTPKLHTVTYASHGGRDDRFCRAVESAVRHKFDLVILGWGVKWRGLSQKLEAAHAYAAALPADDLLLFTDAFDVLFTDTPESIIQNFAETGQGILFSAECGCWPHIMENRGRACFDKYPKSPTPYRYLNSGTWIGQAHLATDMLAEVIREAGQEFGNANDQKLVADMYISGRFGIALDFHNRIFQSMHMTLDPPLPRCNPKEDIETRAGQWHNRRTGGTPAVIHFNGGGKRHHLSMEAQMWYKKRPEHNTAEERAALAAYQLTVPTAPSGKMRFDEICGSYIRGMK